MSLLAQRVEWVYKGQNGWQGDDNSIIADKQNNVYLIGHNPASYTLPLYGLDTLQLKGSYIVKLNNTGNLIKYADSLNAMANTKHQVEINDSNQLYIRSYYYSVGIRDTSFNLIRDIDFYFSNWGNNLYYYELAKNNTLYMTGSWAHMTTPMHYADGPASLMVTSNDSLLNQCHKQLGTGQCTDTYSGDSLGNYYFDKRIYYPNGATKKVLPIYNTWINKFHFNNDGSYSLFGRANPGTNQWCNLPVIQSQDSGYFFARMDSVGNCIWSKSVYNLFPLQIDYDIARITIDDNGNCYFAFNDTGTFYIDTVGITALNRFTSYVAKINRNGYLEYCLPVAVSNGTELIINNIKTDSHGSIFIAGNYFVNYDSVATLNLINYGNFPLDTADYSGNFYFKINPPTSLTATICPGDSVFFGGNFITTPGLYYDSLSINAPNDSVVILDLAYSQPVLNTVNHQLCYGDSLLFNGLYISSTGIYKDTLTASTGCDSIVTLNITATTLFAALQQSSDTLLATATGAINYQWLNCDSNIIYNINQPYFIPPHTGNYAAIVQNGSCTDTSTCINYVTTSINNFSNAGKVSIYPNPTYTSITINFENRTVPLNTKAVLYDIHNKKVMEVAVNTNWQTVNLNKLNQGMYVLTLISDKELFRSMVVKLP